MFSLRNKKNYLRISLNPNPFLEFIIFFFQSKETASQFSPQKFGLSADLAAEKTFSKDAAAGKNMQCHTLRLKTEHVIILV